MVPTLTCLRLVTRKFSRAGPDIAVLRAYPRHRERFLDYAAAHTQPMQKALTFMNLPLHHVVQYITGVTGMKIIRAIVAGERNPQALAEFRDVRCKSSNRLVAHLRLTAVTVGRTNTTLGAFYRRFAARIGKAKAVSATARKLAVLFYNAMRFGMHYSDPGADHYEQKYRDRVIKQLRRRAAEFGFVLQEVKCVS